jgi:hypothetical protein
MQTNVQEGPIRVLAGEDLTADLLVVMTHDTGVPEVKLPDAIDDHAYYITLDDADDADFIDIQPIQAGKNCRLKLDGTCNPGDVLVLAAIDGTHDGMVRTLPTGTSGTYRGIAIAEEKGVDTQLVLARPQIIGNITIV